MEFVKNDYICQQMLGPKKMVDEWIVIRQLWNGATPSGRSKIKTNFQNS